MLQIHSDRSRGSDATASSQSTAPWTAQPGYAERPPTDNNTTPARYDDEESVYVVAGVPGTGDLHLPASTVHRCSLLAHELIVGFVAVALLLICIAHATPIAQVRYRDLPPENATFAHDRITVYLWRYAMSPGAALQPGFMASFTSIYLGVCVLVAAVFTVAAGALAAILLLRYVSMSRWRQARRAPAPRPRAAESAGALAVLSSPADPRDVPKSSQTTAVGRRADSCPPAVDSVADARQLLRLRRRHFCIAVPLAIAAVLSVLALAMGLAHAAYLDGSTDLEEFLVDKGPSMSQYGRGSLRSGYRLLLAASVFAGLAALLVAALMTTDFVLHGRFAVRTTQWSVVEQTSSPLPASPTRWPDDSSLHGEYAAAVAVSATAAAAEEMQFVGASQSVRRGGAGTDSPAAASTPPDGGNGDDGDGDGATVRVSRLDSSAQHFSSPPLTAHTAPYLGSGTQSSVS